MKSFNFLNSSENIWWFSLCFHEQSGFRLEPYSVKFANIVLIWVIKLLPLVGIESGHLINISYQVQNYPFWTNVAYAT